MVVNGRVRSDCASVRPHPRYEADTSFSATYREYAGTCTRVRSFTQQRDRTARRNEFYRLPMTLILLNLLAMIHSLYHAISRCQPPLSRFASCDAIRRRFLRPGKRAPSRTQPRPRVNSSGLSERRSSFSPRTDRERLRGTHYRRTCGSTISAIARAHAAASSSPMLSDQVALKQA